MTLNYKTQEELDAHKREQSHRTSAENRAKKKREEQELKDRNEHLEALCGRLEAERAMMLQEAERLKGAYVQALQELETLRNAPPKIEFRDVPIKRPQPTCIGDVMPMVNHADATWLSNLCPEVEPRLQPFLKCPKCGNKDGSFVDKMICY
jgi:hypothetical protein